jgi:hypothetical protein
MGPQNLQMSRVCSVRDADWQALYVFWWLLCSLADLAVAGRSLCLPSPASTQAKPQSPQGSLEVRQNSVPEAVLASPAVTEVP